MTMSDVKKYLVIKGRKQTMKKFMCLCLAMASLCNLVGCGDSDEESVRTTSNAPTTTITETLVTKEQASLVTEQIENTTLTTKPETTTQAPVKDKFEWIIEPSIEAEDIQPLQYDGDGVSLRHLNSKLTSVSVLSECDEFDMNREVGIIDYNGKIIIGSNHYYNDSSKQIISRRDIEGFQMGAEFLYDIQGKVIEGDIIWDGHYYTDVYCLSDKNFYECWEEDCLTTSPWFKDYIFEGWIMWGEEFPNSDYNTWVKVYVNKNGELITSETFEDGYHFYQGTAACKKDGKWGYINTNGKNVIPFEYDYAYNFDDGIAAVCKNGKWGYIDKNNNTLIDFEFEATRPHYKGQAWVKQNGKWGVIEFNNLLRPDSSDY